MLFKSLVQFGALATALAQPLQHQHHEHQKKDVVVTKVVAVTVDGQTTTLPDATLATSAVNTETPQGQQQQPASFSNPSTFATSTTSGSAPAASSGAAAGGKGITYSPYSDDGGCKSSSQIASEIAQLSSYSVIRLYGVDCNQVDAVLASKSSSQKVFAGIFDVANIQSGIETLSSAVKSNGGWSNIHTVAIGNELVNSGEANPGQIASYIKQGKSALISAGYLGPVVSVDTFIAVINNPSLCELSDYIAVNAHAFFDGGVAASGAGDWVLLQIQRVSEACGGKKSVFITETGWPSQGDSNNKAVPSKSNQKAAIDSISEKCGNDAILFTAFNDLWKASGPYNAEKYWGLLSN